MVKPKKIRYYENAREDLIQLIPQGARRVLDVGCGIGNLGAAIKAKRGPSVEVVGVELDIDAAEKARKVLDKVIAGNIETIDLPFEQKYFDCIVYGDVLEHLMDPWALLKRHKAFLKPKGYVLASIPNIAHYRIIKMLKKHEWNYQEAGILDECHIRFFTIKSIKRMFEDAGFNIRAVDYIICGSNVKKTINKIFKNCLIDSIAEEYLITAQKID